MFSRDQFGVNYFVTQNNMIWGIDEFDLAQDVYNYNNVLTNDERTLLKHILRFFTRSDEHVEGAYQSVLPSLFDGEDELGFRMMFAAFANMESMHILAYSHLTETLGFSKKFYKEFQEVEEMAKKEEDMLRLLKTGSLSSLIEFSMCYEGISLFGLFILLIGFELSGLLPNIGRIVTLSMRDENLHTSAMTDLTGYVLREKGGSFDPELLLSKMQEFTVKEIAFIRSISDGLVDLNADVKEILEKIDKYFEWLLDFRMSQIQNKVTTFKTCPFEWLELKWEYEHINFFTSTVTEYQRLDNICNAFSKIDGV